DDKPETVKKRLDTYEKQTAPLINYYGAQGKLVNVKAVNSIEENFAAVKKVLND
ncbi:MAG: nucleoside monophosphate kinase, partial [Clostridia bacterium]|nr:nucleoside monophosphate kinase [Clostridia bacterium]